MSAAARCIAHMAGVLNAYSDRLDQASAVLREASRRRGNANRASDAAASQSVHALIVHRRHCPSRRHFFTRI